MDFFQQKTEVNFTNKMLRSALLEEVMQQGVLKVDTIVRVTF